MQLLSCGPSELQERCGYHQDSKLAEFQHIIVDSSVLGEHR